MITNRRSLWLVLALTVLAAGCASSGSYGGGGGGGGYAAGDLDCYSNYDPSQAAYGYGSGYGYSYGGYGYSDPCSAYPSRYVGYYPDYAVSTPRHVALADHPRRTHTVQRPGTDFDSPFSGTSSASSSASVPAPAPAVRMDPAPVSAPAPSPTTVHPRGN